jgi:hypothetical protein
MTVVAVRTFSDCVQRVLIGISLLEPTQRMCDAQSGVRLSVELDNATALK